MGYFWFIRKQLIRSTISKDRCVYIGTYLTIGIKTNLKKNCKERFLELEYVKISNALYKPGDNIAIDEPWLPTKIIMD